MKLFAEELRSFPDPRLTLDEGILDISDDLRVERLFEAYSFGIFPWPHEDLPTLWYCPNERGVLDFSDLHVPDSLAKFLRKTSWGFSVNREFDRVLEHCAAAPRPNQKGTWITKKLNKAYREFHRAGYAHSLEVWEADELIGGLYGVYVGGVFCGESMFFLKSNASKFALIKLIGFLKENGLSWIDIQMVTPLMKSLGGKYIPRERFLQRLEISKKSAKQMNFKT